MQRGSPMPWAMATVTSRLSFPIQSQSQKIKSNHRFVEAFVTVSFFTTPGTKFYFLIPATKDQCSLEKCYFTTLRGRQYVSPPVTLTVDVRFSFKIPLAVSKLLCEIPHKDVSSLEGRKLQF